MALVHFWRATRLALLIGVSLMSLNAQTASLRCQVTDESGAVVPGARVVLGNSGVKNQTVTTDGSGAYSFKFLTPGEYLLSGAAQQITAGGSVNLRWNIRVSPFVILQSGVPFNITTGADTYGTTLFNLVQASRSTQRSAE